MSDGFVTVAQCVEGLPLGRFVWEVLFCGFLAWFLLGAINDCTPLAFSIVTTDWATTQESVMQLSAALTLGNFVAVAVGGWAADTYGRMAVVRPALVLTVAAGILLQTATSLPHALAARFVLGLVSGGLLSTMPPLIAELLPSRQRGFYLTVWCCGWPAGALFGLALGYMFPGIRWREFYTLLLTPAVFLYVGTRVEMLPESPRFLYMAGRREEGFCTLLDMYEKQELMLPWANESIAVTGSSAVLPPEPPALSGHARSSCSGAADKATSRTSVTVWLALAMFAASAAAQSVRLWMPTMLIANQEDALAAGAGGQDAAAAGGEVVRMTSLLSFAAGPRAVSLLSLVRAPLMIGGPGSDAAVRVLAEAYLVEFVGIILCAFLSTRICRKNMVQWPLLAAAVLTVLNLGNRQAPYCGLLVGAQLAAQASGLNFLQVFASEYFPTSRRAQTVAFVNFVAQLGTFVVPVVGGFVVRNSSASAAVVSFGGMYLMAWACSCRLPLPTGAERPLHDVDDEPRSCLDADFSLRKRAWTSYQSA